MPAGFNDTPAVDFENFQPQCRILMISPNQVSALASIHVEFTQINVVIISSMSENFQLSNLIQKGMGDDII